jgi:hypothetical protein
MKCGDATPSGERGDAASGERGDAARASARAASARMIYMDNLQRSRRWKRQGSMSSREAVVDATT